VDESEAERTESAEPDECRSDRGRQTRRRGPEVPEHGSSCWTRSLVDESEAERTESAEPDE